MADISVIRSALPALESQFRRASEAKEQIEAERQSQSHPGGFEEPKAALTSLLEDVYEHLLIVLEGVGLPNTRILLKKRWRRMKRNGGIGKSSWNGQFEYLEHPAYEHISTVISGMHAMAEDPMSSRNAYDLANLESLLRRTAVLLNRRMVTPQKEGDIKAVMADYLEAAFTEFVPNPQINGAIKSFKPDGGIRDLKAAFEYKFATTKEEVRTCLGGIYEDISGYAGSLDWTRFYSVVYQTEAFFSQEHFDRDFARAKITAWKPILVTGEGLRKIPQEMK